MIACILKSHGAWGKGESVEGLFMKCVEAGFLALVTLMLRSVLPVVRGQAPSPQGLCKSLALFKHRLGPLANLCFGQILLARGQKPHMPERVFQRPGTVTVKLILRF